MFEFLNFLGVLDVLYSFELFCYADIIGQGLGTLDNYLLRCSPTSDADCTCITWRSLPKIIMILYGSKENQSLF